MFLCACLCVLAVLANPAKGDTIKVTNTMRSKEILSDLIVYSDPNDPDPKTGKWKKKVLVAPDDPNDDIVLNPKASVTFHADFKIWLYETSTPILIRGWLYYDSPTYVFRGKIGVPKKVGFIRDPDEQQTVVLTQTEDYIDAPWALLAPEGTVLACTEGIIPGRPGWFVGTDINFDTGEVTGAYTGNVEVLATVFEVLVFTPPYPPDGAVEIPLYADLHWPKSEEAVSYDVYFGTDFDDVKYGRRGTFKGNTTARYYEPGTLERCYDYYWRVEPVEEEEEEEIIVDWVITTGDVRIYADIFKFGEVWSFTTVGRKAMDPYPANGAIDVSPHVILSWDYPYCYIIPHYDVYFGIDFYAVANADTSDTTGIYRGRQAVDANSYDPGTLEPGTAYYWKVEEGNEPPPPPPEWQGSIWSFMTAAPPEPPDEPEPPMPDWTELSFPYDGLDHVFAEDLDALPHKGFVINSSEDNIMPFEVFAIDSNGLEIPYSRYEVLPAMTSMINIEEASQYAFRMPMSIEGPAALTANISVKNANVMEGDTSSKCDDTDDRYLSLPGPATYAVEVNGFHYSFGYKQNSECDLRISVNLYDISTKTETTSVPTVVPPGGSYKATHTVPKGKRLIVHVVCCKVPGQPCYYSYKLEKK